MATNDDWGEASAGAIYSVSSSVVSSTATGHPDIARAGAQVVVYITNNIFSISPPHDDDQQKLEGLQTVATAYEQSAAAAGVPSTYIFQLKQDRDNDLKQATGVVGKASVWAHYVAGLGKVINEWAGILKPFGGVG